MAIDLHRQGRIQHILVSGDNRTNEHNEPAAMALYLGDQGIPAEDITEDFGGRSTLDTCNRASEVFGISNATLITHLPPAQSHISLLSLRYRGNRCRARNKQAEQ